MTCTVVVYAANTECVGLTTLGFRTQTTPRFGPVRSLARLPMWMQTCTIRVRVFSCSDQRKIKSNQNMPSLNILKI